MAAKTHSCQHDVFSVPRGRVAFQAATLLFLSPAHARLPLGALVFEVWVWPWLTLPVKGECTLRYTNKDTCIWYMYLPQTRVPITIRCFRRPLAKKRRLWIKYDTSEMDQRPSKQHSGSASFIPGGKYTCPGYFWPREASEGLPEPFHSNAFPQNQKGHNSVFLTLLPLHLQLHLIFLLSLSPACSLTLVSNTQEIC